MMHYVVLSVCWLVLVAPPLLDAHQKQQLYDGGAQGGQPQAHPHAAAAPTVRGAGAQRAQQFHDKAHTGDKEHIMEHLDGHVDADKISEQEMNFHYFKIHDYDHNTRLDGIELIAALTDYHRESSSENLPGMSDTELADMVDSILQEDDGNNDGYIDYPEFIVSQQKDKNNLDPNEIMT